ncbi:hypothetical protein L1887_59635 [Cichorium endivia]|nr:hypothetical protein L1887_59635 [Cichorium endivia]
MVWTQGSKHLVGVGELVDVTDGHGGWLGLEQLLCDLGQRCGLHGFEGGEGVLERSDAAGLEQLGRDELVRSRAVLEHGGALELGLGDSRLDGLLLETTGDVLERLGDLGCGLLDRGRGRRDVRTKHTRVGEGEVEGGRTSAGDGLGDLRERRHTVAPLDRRFAAEQRTQHSEVGRSLGVLVAGTLEADEEVAVGGTRVLGAVRGSEGYALLTTKVLGGRGGDRGGGSELAKVGRDELAELGRVDARTEHGDVVLGEGGVRKVDGLTVGDGRGGRGEERVAEAALAVGGLEEAVVAQHGGVGLRLGVLGLDLGEHLLVELVRSELGLGEDVAEDLDEELLIAAQELGGEQQVLLGEGGGEDTAVELGLADEAQGGALLVGLEEVVLQHMGDTGGGLVARTGLDGDGDGGGEGAVVSSGGLDAGSVGGGKGALLVGGGAERGADGRGGTSERHVDGASARGRGRGWTSDGCRCVAVRRENDDEQAVSTPPSGLEDWLAGASSRSIEAAPAAIVSLLAFSAGQAHNSSFPIQSNPRRTAPHAHSRPRTMSSGGDASSRSPGGSVRAAGFQSDQNGGICKFGLSFAPARTSAAWLSIPITEPIQPERASANFRLSLPDLALLQPRTRRALHGVFGLAHKHTL